MNQKPRSKARKGTSLKKPQMVAATSKLGSSPTNAAVPTKVRELSEKLSRYPGVVGVFWGTGRKGRTWERPRAISVHVRWKRGDGELAEGERLPKKLEGYDIDVIEVGHPTVDALDHADRIFGEGGRSSTITAIGSEGNKTFALLSGHGTLPLVNGKIATAFDAAGPPVEVEVRDDIGVNYRGRLLRGRIGNNLGLDFAVAEFEVSVVANTFHLAVGDTPPFRMRTKAVAQGEPLFHYSSLRKRRMRGLFQQASVTTLELRLPDDQRATYAEVLVVDNDGVADFSVGGDSGSLVVDEQGDVVGAVLGSSVTARIAYVLGLQGLESLVPAAFALIFETTP